MTSGALQVQTCGQSWLEIMAAGAWGIGQTAFTAGKQRDMHAGIQSTFSFLKKWGGGSARVRAHA